MANEEFTGDVPLPKNDVMSEQLEGLLDSFAELCRRDDRGPVENMADALFSMCVSASHMASHRICHLMTNDIGPHSARCVGVVTDTLANIPAAFSMMLFPRPERESLREMAVRVYNRLEVLRMVEEALRRVKEAISDDSFTAE